MRLNPSILFASLFVFDGVRLPLWSYSLRKSLPNDSLIVVVKVSPFFSDLKLDVALQAKVAEVKC